MIYPKFLEKQSCIGVPAPSDGAYCEQDVNRYKNAKNNLERLGYKIELSKNIFSSEKGRSSDALTRANEFNKMIADKEIDAILCAAGGEFLMEQLTLDLVQNY